MFSASGVTKRVGEEIARISGADFFKTVPKEIYTSADIDWMNKKSRSEEFPDDPCGRLSALLFGVPCVFAAGRVSRHLGGCGSGAGRSFSPVLHPGKIQCRYHQLPHLAERFEMIKDCMNGQIDMVITKSISRFARNTLDTLKYVQQLKEKNIAVYLEGEKINTLSMDGELLLVVLSSVAQQEVENISANTKKGIAMKMPRGEMVGFVRAPGCNYDPETKTISINEEAKIVRFIFDEYVKGNGARVIARKLEAMGALTAYGCKHWQETTIIGIICSEKYMGDLVQGKTFTVDPISHHRLENQGEVNKYVVKDHHEALVSKKVWNKAQAIQFITGCMPLQNGLCIDHISE